MNGIPQADDGRARAAALTLHALPETDRVWVLERLDRPQRRLMDGLLEELATLRIPADPALVQSAIEAAGLHAPASALPEVGGPVAPATIATLLSREPHAVVIAVLTSLSRSDATATLSHFPSPAGDALREAWLDAEPPPPAVQDALRRALSTLAECDGVPAILRERP